jgi:hypothetical protein
MPTPNGGRLRCRAVRKILVLLAVAVLLGACGGGGDDGETRQEPVSSDSGGDIGADEYTAALAESMQGPDGFPSIDETQATCVARGLVDALGADTLNDAGVTPGEFAAAEGPEDLDIEVPPDAVDNLGQSIAACDVAEVLEQDVVIDPFADEFGYDLPSDGVACLSSQIDDQALSAAVAEVFLTASTDALTTVEADAIVACPHVAVGAFAAEAGAPLAPEVEQCVADFVAANPDLVRGLMGAGGEAQAAVEQFGTQLAAACPEFAAT